MSKKSSSGFDFIKDYQLVAIVSSLKDYALCYNINNKLDLDLVKYNDILIPSISGDERNFSWYYFKDEISRTSYYLMGNKCERENLLKSQKAVDYFLFIKNPVDKKMLNPILVSLRKISNIMVVFELDMQQQKNMETLLEAIELHELEVI